MKNVFMAVLISLGVFSLGANRAHAIVGLVAKSPTVIALGGLVTAGGAVIAFQGATSTEISTESAFGKFFGGIGALILGLVILDDSQEAEVVFTKLDHYPGFDADALAIYNAELDELNAINQSVTEQIKHDPTLDAAALWKEYSSVLSDETVKIAALVSSNLVGQLR